MVNVTDSLKAFVNALPPAHRDLITATTKGEFDEAFAQIIYDAVRRLEKDSKKFRQLDEDSLSSIFVGFVSGTGALTVTREENSNGHVDMTFQAPLCQPPREALGEAKIYRCYSWHEGGLGQLMHRYSTGREERGLLLVYMKEDDVRGHMEALRKELDATRPYSQLVPCDGHAVKWSFVSKHRHHSGEEMEVWHLGCNLYHPDAGVMKRPRKASSAKKTAASPRAPKR